MTGTGRSADGATVSPWAQERGLDAVGRRREAGEQPDSALWVFVLGDMTTFALFFVVLLAQRRSASGVFTDGARELLVPLGLVNTVLLLTSSLGVVLAVRAHREDRLRRAADLVGTSALCGLVFAGIKSTEYAVELGRGHTVTTSPFFTLYFAVTGLHLVHVLVGVALLMWWRGRIRELVPFSRARWFADGVAVYWHMVDLLWVVIFTLVYLVARS